MDDADCSCRIAFSSILITFYKNDRTKLNNISTIKNKLQFANFIVRYLKRNKNSVNRLHLRHYFPLPQRKNFTVVAYLLVGYLIAQILAHRLEEEAENEKHERSERKSRRESFFFTDSFPSSASILWTVWAWSAIPVFSSGTGTVRRRTRTPRRSRLRSGAR